MGREKIKSSKKKSKEVRKEKLKKKNKKGKVLKSSGEDDVSLFLDNNSLFDIEERSSRLPSLGVDSFVDPKQCISTGMLCLDLVCGGGYQAGKEYELVGEEHGGKTTTIYMAIGSAIRHIPNQVKAVFLDIESKVDPTWMKRITGINSMNDIFGKKKSDGSGWEIPPKVRYYKPAFGEQGLKFIKKLLKRMPDKVLVGDIWYYVWTPKESKTVKKTGGYTLADLRTMLKDRYDKKLFSKYGAFYVPVPNNYSGPEFLILVDSWAAMTPESIAEDDSNAMGAQARMFSKHLNDVKALMSSKGVTLIGTNQIRTKIGAYGNPEYSPGGNTKRHTTDVRLKFKATRNMNGSGAIDKEGQDEYKHFYVKNTKNKTFVPNKECRGRWWYKHGSGTGFGPCPVQDTLNYLKMTDQISIGRKGFTINLEGKNPVYKKLSKINFDIKKFKEVVLEKKIGSTKIDIRKLCFKQLRSGKGIRLFLKNKDYKID